jgi:metal-responsive CopG/Arc/MetJ family transcriptional regulator
VKTAISLPDDLYERASLEARRLGMSRSELFATAARRYLDDLARRDITARIDAVLSPEGADESHRWAVAAGRGALDRAEW